MRTLHTLSSVLLCGLVVCVAARADDTQMTVHYIDVGQANATLLQFSCGAMLIDAGAEDDKYADRLVSYLDRTLTEEVNGRKVIDIVFITHTHRDHNSVLKRIIEEFEVKRYVDNGDVFGSGKPGATAIRKAIKNEEVDTKLTEVRDEKITNMRTRRGYWSRQIDPFRCTGCDPKIRILSAGMDEPPDGWSNSDFDNENNHSLVIRVDFGESSFLFPGDLEDAGIETMLAWYKESPAALDADVWEVNHHGAENGTTPDLIDAISPEIAIISCGNMEYGKASTNKWDAFAYGHPRAKVVALLQENNNVTTTRPAPVEVDVADKSQIFHKTTVTKSIYATGWDGTVIVRGFCNKEPIVVETLHEPQP